MLTRRVAALAAANNLTFVDAFNDTELRRPAYWSADRLHLNAVGHQRVAGLVLAALGAGPTPDDREHDLAPRRRLLTEAAYYRDHVLPWIGRRLRGRSSGDLQGAKRTTWTVVEAAEHI